MYITAKRKLYETLMQLKEQNISQFSTSTAVFLSGTSPTVGVVPLRKTAGFIYIYIYNLTSLIKKPTFINELQNYIYIYIYLCVSQYACDAELLDVVQCK